VLRPQSHTHPTKLVLAFTASHMIATSVLLDCRVTFWALLCVGGNPVGRLGIISTLLEPLLD
jgi:hypothetical protein